MMDGKISWDDFRIEESYMYLSVLDLIIRTTRSFRVVNTW